MSSRFPAALRGWLPTTFRVLQATTPYGDVKVCLELDVMGKGGSELCLEMKAYNDLLPKGSSGEGETSVRGSTHGFGNTEECCVIL